ncbi:hypothetical protein [Rhodospirillum centenum]|uniref:Uncharacterized protein n=1 Tax=Rhodospirillum centenum (strain ATCC 51521 / SW) TaxID=414684 RepID=B6IMX9_RHOCS|nr:hypothetical protein [Rhodospirillum centenum]ACI98876.1 hypothetical protein RC1_1472 [Rhodospirillum centenum SW]
MAAFYDFETTLTLKSHGEMDKAEDWIRGNIKGLWAVEFLGLEERVDSATRARSQVLHVRFKFGRREDFDRFRHEYVQGRPPAAAARKTAVQSPQKRKGLLGWLLK